MRPSEVELRCRPSPPPSPPKRLAELPVCGSTRESCGSPRRPPPGAPRFPGVAGLVLRLSGALRLTTALHRAPSACHGTSDASRARRDYSRRVEGHQAEGGPSSRRRQARCRLCLPPIIIHSHPDRSSSSTPCPAPSTSSSLLRRRPCVCCAASPLAISRAARAPFSLSSRPTRQRTGLRPPGPERVVAAGPHRRRREGEAPSPRGRLRVLSCPATLLQVVPTRRSGELLTMSSWAGRASRPSSSALTPTPTPTAPLSFAARSTRPTGEALPLSVLSTGVRRSMRQRGRGSLSNSAATDGDSSLSCGPSRTRVGTASALPCPSTRLARLTPLRRGEPCTCHLTTFALSFVPKR